MNTRKVKKAIALHPRRGRKIDNYIFYNPKIDSYECGERVYQIMWDESKVHLKVGVK